MPYEQLRAADPLSTALNRAGLETAGWIVSFGAVVALSAVLLVFQYGQPRIFFAMARDGLLPQWAAKVHPKYRTPHVTTVLTGVFVAVGALVMDENEIYDLTNIGTLSAFAIVCIGVLALRLKEPDRHRPFRVRFVWPVGLIGAGACVYVMTGLPPHAWERFGIWLAIGHGPVLRLRLPPLHRPPRFAAHHFRSCHERSLPRLPVAGCRCTRRSCSAWSSAAGSVSWPMFFSAATMSWSRRSTIT